MLNISDWHAQLIPLTEAADTVGPVFNIGGSAFLKPWFDVYRKEARNGSLTLTGGDSFGGATPPISNAFDDKPTPPIMSLMGVDAEAVGNHQFDRGEQFLRNELIPLADFPILSANVVFPNGTTPPEWSPSAEFKFGGVRIGVVGFTTEDTPELLFPGRLGPFEVRTPLPLINAEAAKLRHRWKRPVDAVIALGHEGANAGALQTATGPLMDIADGTSNVDVVIGDHNDIQVLSYRPNGVLVTENRGKGIRFTRIRIVVDTNRDEVVYKTADFHRPWNIGVTPDPTIQARIDKLNADLAPIFGAKIGDSTRAIPRADSCGNANGRRCESLVGNTVTDALRLTYAKDFAITNSGGLRADLTCPTSDNPNDFCPAFTPPPFPITRGQNFGVLPFGNIVVTLSVNGAELKTMLENGVSIMPAENGRFPQVSGLCFTYNVEAPAGSRVTGAVRQVAWGVHGCPDRPHGWRRPLLDPGERLHGERGRRLSELREPDGDARHHGRGAGGLHQRQHARSARRSKAGSSAPTRPRALATTARRSPRRRRPELRGLVARSAAGPLARRLRGWQFWPGLPGIQQGHGRNHRTHHRRPDRRRPGPSHQPGARSDGLDRDHRDRHRVDADRRTARRRLARLDSRRDRGGHPRHRRAARAAGGAENRLAA